VPASRSIQRVGTGHFSHLGNSTTWAFANSFTGVGESVVTAANGDKLFEDFTNVTVDPQTFVAQFDVTVVRGTGRFQGATGSGHDVLQLVSLPDGTDFAYTGSFQGTISY